MTKVELRCIVALLQLYTLIDNVSVFFHGSRVRSFTITIWREKMIEQVEDILAISGDVDGPLVKLWRSVLDLLQRLPDDEAKLSKSQVLAIYFLASHTWYSRALADDSAADAEKKRLFVVVHPLGALIEFYGLGSKYEANPEEFIGTLLKKRPWWKFWE